MEPPKTDHQKTDPKDWEADLEARATATFGPPEIRTQKNQEYVANLVREHSEATIRGLLMALAQHGIPGCCKFLRRHALETTPLDQVIRPFEILGLHFHVEALLGNQYEVKMREADGLMGSGGTIILERLKDHSFRVMEVIEEWIA